MMKVVADVDIPHLKEMISSDFDCMFIPGKIISSSDVKNADILIVRTRTICNRDLLNGSSVKLIATATIGTDHIDLEYCKEAGIKVFSAAGCNARSVQCYIASVLSYLHRNRGGNLETKTLGIVGHGNVGSLVEQVGKALGMRVLINDPPKESIDNSIKYSTIDQIIEESDIITFHVPLTNEGIYKTRDLVNIDFINRIKNNMILINTSRGEIIEHSALQYFNSRNIILDVWENEPDINLYHLMNVCLGTPHIAGYSADGKMNGTKMVVEELYRFAKINKHATIPQLSCNIESSIEINCANRPANDVISSIIKKIYNVDEDSIRLKYSPGTFEHQRANYRMRRDFDYYDLKLKGATQELINRLTLLNFNSITND